jgi:hypothetical protein
MCLVEMGIGLKGEGLHVEKSDNKESPRRLIPISALESVFGANFKQVRTNN